MTKNDAKKLRRGDLLELLIEQTEENQRLMNKISQLETKLSERVIVMEQAGSIADAALGLTEVFSQAQDSADRYLESIRQKQAEAEDALRQAREKAKQIEQKAREEGQTTVRKAQEEGQATLQKAQEEARALSQKTQEEAQGLTRQTREKAEALTAQTQAECARQREKARADCKVLECQTQAECEKRLTEAEQKAAEIVAAAANSAGAPTDGGASKRRGIFGRLRNRR